MEKCASMYSVDEKESDFEDDDTELDHHHRTKKSDYKTTTQKLAQPVCLVRFVTRLNGPYSLSKMINDKEIWSKVAVVCLNQSETVDIAKMVDDCDNDNNDVEFPGLIVQSEGEQYVDIDLNDIRQKALEYDRQQLKGIQFANAGNGNLRVMNNYAVTSNTCTLI